MAQGPTSLLGRPDPRRAPALSGLSAGAAAGALALSPVLPDLGRGTGAVLAATGPALALLFMASYFSCWSATGSNAAAAVLLVAALAVAVPFAALDVEPVATPARMLAATALGVLLVHLLERAWQIAVIAVIGALVDTVSVIAGPTGRLAEDSPGTIEAIAMHLPLWGDAGTILLGTTDGLFIAIFTAGAIRFGLRPLATAAAEVLAMVGAICLAAGLGHDLPALPFAAAAALLVNADLLRRHPSAPPGDRRRPEDKVASAAEEG